MATLTVYVPASVSSQPQSQTGTQGVSKTLSVVASGTELSFNAKIAANLGSPVVLVLHGRGRTPDQIRAAADSARRRLG